MESNLRTRLCCKQIFVVLSNLRGHCKVSAKNSHCPFALGPYLWTCYPMCPTPSLYIHTSSHFYSPFSGLFENELQMWPLVPLNTPVCTFPTKDPPTWQPQILHIGRDTAAAELTPSVPAVSSVSASFLGRDQSEITCCFWLSHFFSFLSMWNHSSVSPYLCWPWQCIDFSWGFCSVPSRLDSGHLFRQEDHRNEAGSSSGRLTGGPQCPPLRYCDGAPIIYLVKVVSARLSDCKLPLSPLWVIEILWVGTPRLHQYRIPHQTSPQP